ncbi:hypothetical protein G9F32_09680 [Acinetobacter sp. 194]|uniref:hypothetical protein n=1 Tax=Acinetobacter shaoyimingii TaxID=2715164 RepID=UPI00140B9F89|nr:hypothetical protein [Acinetobacter shaoyimingii]NHB58286.1 hypothetical protein [Acinetobacter shaoyimingii]
MNVLRIDYTLGKVEFRINDKNIVINNYGKENNNDLISFGFENFIDPLGQSCYTLNFDFQGYIFYAKLIYKDGFLKL